MAVFTRCCFSCCRTPSLFVFRRCQTAATNAISEQQITAMIQPMDAADSASASEPKASSGLRNVVVVVTVVAGKVGDVVGADMVGGVVGPDVVGETLGLAVVGSIVGVTVGSGVVGLEVDGAIVGSLLLGAMLGAALGVDDVGVADGTEAVGAWVGAADGAEVAGGVVGLAVIHSQVWPTVAQPGTHWWVGTQLQRWSAPLFSCSQIPCWVLSQP